MMNLDDTHDIDVDSHSAAVVAAAMREVAKADGDVHPRELALIAEMADGLPDADPRTPLATDLLRRAYLQSLAMVALADGVISEAERTVIADLAASQGLDPDDVEIAVEDARRQFLGVFAGVQHFRADAEDIGRGLGLSDDAIVDVLDA